MNGYLKARRVQGVPAVGVAAARAVGLALGATLFAAGVAGAAEIPIPVANPAPLDRPEKIDKMFGELRVRNVSQPSLTAFLPAQGRGNGTAVIVAPGGGFVMLSWESEGTRVAQRLAELGYTAFVLKYRLNPTPSDTETFTADFLKMMKGLEQSTEPQIPGPAERYAAADAAGAIRLVRQRAAEWGVDSKRVGIVGFSAGGMTASNVATLDIPDRPNFVGIIYGGLRNPVPRDAPPAFIATAADDHLLKDAAIPMFQAWRAAGRPAELHLYEKGGHGFGMNVRGHTSDRWFDQFVWWLEARGMSGTSPAKP